MSIPKIARERSADDPLMSVAQAAAYMGVSRTWMHYQLQKKRIPYVELGEDRSKRRLRRSVVNAFIESKEVHARTSESKKVAAA